MRQTVKNVITPEEADHLLDTITLEDRFNVRVKFSDSTPPVVQKVLDRFSEIVDFKLHEESYWRVQRNYTDILDWHVDGNPNGNMRWCSYGLSLILVDNGARMWYRSRIGRFVEAPVEGMKRLDMYIHSSDEIHMVEYLNEEQPRITLALFV